MSREESTPFAADVLYKVRTQIKGNSDGDPWLTEKQLEELEGIFQNVAVSALSKKLFVENRLESHIFYELIRSSKDKAAKLLSDKLSEDNGVVRVAEIIGILGLIQLMVHMLKLMSNHFLWLLILIF